MTRSRVVDFPPGDNREGAPSVVCHAVQVVTARRDAMLVAEGMHQARQPIDADWKVSVEIQAGAGTVAILKKAGLYRSSPENHRPISNLSTVSKILERLALTRLRPHLLESTNFSKYQSAYRKGHSTETALLEILDGVYTAADDKQVTVLISLDLSAAFHTLDHKVLLQRLQSEFGVTDTTLSWLRSYLESRTQFVKLDQHQSPDVGLDVGVPQGPSLVLCCQQSTAVRRPTST